MAICVVRSAAAACNRRFFDATIHQGLESGRSGLCLFLLARVRCMRIFREKEPSLAAWVDGRLRWSKYGMVSMERDRSYAEGQGDLVKSVALIERQLEIYPDFPSRHHDLATTHVMLSETLEAASTRAVQSFRTAQERAVQAWRAGLKERGRAGPECSGRLVFDWEGELGAGSALVSVDPVVRGVECSGCEDHGAYVATFKNAPGLPMASSSPAILW